MPQFIQINGQVLHAAFDPGEAGRTAVVFANSLGTDLRIWDAVIALLPVGTPVLRVDKRGHGLSPDGPVSIPALAADMAGLMDYFGLSQAVVCGVSVGGMIAQALAVARPDLVRSVVLSNTAMKIGSADTWNPRIDAVRAGGIAPIADAVLERWFAPSFLTHAPVAVEGYRAMLVRTPAEGYAQACEALRDTDLTADAPKLIQPAICLAGADDQATPVELVQALAEALPDATLRVLPNAGHLPCIEAPEAVVQALSDIGAFE